jgi:hypothetical protein
MPNWNAIDARLSRDSHPDDEPAPPADARPIAAPDGGAGGWEAFDDPDAPGDQPTTADIRVSDLQDQSRADIRTLADRLGLLPYGQPDADGEPRKWKDPDTGQQRLRIDEGHVDRTTGEPYNDPKAAVPHAHAYDQDGQKIVDPDDGNAHFPLR